MTKKILLFPGWMKSVGFYQNYEGLDIWKNTFVVPDKIIADYAIAHSLGVNFMLERVALDPECKIILINPLLSEKNSAKWIWRWFKFVLFGSPRVDWKMNHLNFFSAFWKMLKLEKGQNEKIFAAGLRENVTVVRGQKDKFFCDEKEAVWLRAKGIQVLEFENLGHEWNEKYNDVINKIVNN